MSKSITVSITLTQAELKRALKSAGLKIVDSAKFEQKLSTAKFQKELARDIKHVWQLTNEDDSGDGLAMLFNDVVDFE